MKLKYKSLDKEFNNSFFVRRITRPVPDGNWHFHEEFELIYIIKGAGIRIVGDNISNYSSPQLVLVAPWLPHLWKDDEQTETPKDINIIVIKFSKLFRGQDIFSIPEYSEISGLLENSQRGLIFDKTTIRKVHNYLDRMPEANGAERLINLQIVLDFLSKSKKYKKLSSPEFNMSVALKRDNRLDKVIGYISNNFMRHISLDELANEAAMTRSSFCRFFKNRTNKTTFRFINEFRIGEACQLLINGNQSISEICFATGFNSLTSFNRVFKEFKGVSPREFKKKYISLNTPDIETNEFQF
ncbi:MAG: helix-turn-helix domain-containing protein [Bacteroidales bacterium]|nr:helix-turn-helix domain-containing protein [Bacteroidales bacterium]